MNRIHPVTLGCVALGLAAASHAGEVVYNNLITPLGNYVGGFGYEEIADDVALAVPGARLFESATVAYAGFNFDGDETLTMTIYKMDGAPTAGSFGFNTPGTVLYTATTPIAATPGMTVTFLDNTGILLPDVVAVGLSFGGVDFDPTGAGSDGGPLLFDPPAPGSSFDDYWLRGFPNPGDDWGLFTFGGNPPINLGLQITAGLVPEPGTWMSMGGLVALVGTVLYRRMRRSA